MSGSGWASDDAATRLAGGLTVTVRCGAVRVRCSAVADGGARRGRGKERDVAPAGGGGAAADETAWGRRLVAAAGLRALGGSWSRGAVRCSSAQRSARNTQAGAPAGPEIELMQRSQVMLFGVDGRLKARAGWNEPQKRAPVEIPDGRVESRW